MLNVRDTQTHSSRRLVPLYSQTNLLQHQREINKNQTHTCIATHSACCLLAWQGYTQGLEPPTLHSSPLRLHPTTETQMQPTQVSKAAVWVKTQTASIPRQTRCKKYDWYKDVEKNERGIEKDQVNTEISLVTPTEGWKRRRWPSMQSV